MCPRALRLRPSAPYPVMGEPRRTETLGSCCIRSSDLLNTVYSLPSKNSSDTTCWGPKALTRLLHSLIRVSTVIARPRWRDELANTNSKRGKGRHSITAYNAPSKTASPARMTIEYEVPSTADTGFGGMTS
eukprot:150419-Pyramimonas_sp.AAC.1